MEPEAHNSAVGWHWTHITSLFSRYYELNSILPSIVCYVIQDLQKNPKHTFYSRQNKEQTQQNWWKDILRHENWGNFPKSELNGTHTL